MTGHQARSIQSILRGALYGGVVLALTGCGPTSVTTGPTATLPTATDVAVVPTASAAASASAVASLAPPIATQVRNPAAMDAAVPYHPVIDPADFVEVINNPYWPLTPGASYEFESADEQIKVVVTSERRTVMGVSTVVVSDKVFADGKLAEDTSDWYAQDRAGNVWYFGEATLSFEDDPAGDPAGRGRLASMGRSRGS